MRKGCLISAVAVVGILSVLLILYFVNQGNSDDALVEFEKPRVMDIVQKAVATGAIKPRQEVLIKPQVSGVVDELYVEAGEIVKKGQRLARIKLVPSEVNINNAQSSVQLARIRLEEAQRELERQKAVFENKLDVESAKAAFENARTEERRQSQLLEQGVISQQAYDRTKMNLEQQRTAYENAKLVSNNALRAAEAQVDIAHQELNAAVNNLQLLKEGAAKSSSQVANIVVSTVDGMVLDVPVETGSSVIERNNFNEGTTIAEVADMTTLVFEGQVDESDVGKLKEGMPLVLTVGAIQDKAFDAVLEYIAPKGVEEEGSVKFEIKAAIEPAGDVFLRAGYSASADIILDRKEGVIAINERDLIFGDSSNYVEIKNGATSVEKVPVQIGLSDGIMVEIQSGIDTTKAVKVQNKG